MIPTAILAGFFAGFFGIGGAIVTIPLLVYFFQLLEINKEFIMHLAVGTSFSIIIPTAIVSVFTHNKLKAVDFNIVKSYGFFIIIGVILGTIFATTLKSKSLILFFSIVLYLMSINFFFQKENSKFKINFTLKLKFMFGIIVGFISSLMGIAGATFNVPILKYCGYPINKAIGTAAAIGFFISLFGAIGFLSTGFYLNTNLPMSFGFVNIPALLIFAPITSFMARIGAKSVHKVDKSKIHKLFAIFLLIVACKFMYDYFQL